MGTGWLIRPDIFVTAGHCSYDWSHKLGRATEVKAYIGYDGNQSEKDPNVQFRHVKKIVTTEGWVKTKGQKAFDVSFMQVDPPFTGITPVRFEETPSQGNLVLGVVGYPGDLSDKRTGERGAHMYECFIPTEFDLSTQADTMLEYQIDTFGGEPCTYLLQLDNNTSNGCRTGNSGSPVLRKHDLVSIGAHVYGGTFNSASVIGKYGNPYEDYIAAFGLLLTNDGLNLIPITGNRAVSAPVPSGYGSSIPVSMAMIGSRKAEGRHASRAQEPIVPKMQPRSQYPRHSSLTKLVQNGRVPRGQDSNVQSQPTDAEEAGFMDVLRTVASALPTGLGIVGGPIGALAGFALNAASNLTAETVAAESDMDGRSMHEGSMERAILAEATLSALQSAEWPSDLEESIFSDMKNIVMKALPVIRKAAPHVMGAMMEPALKIALDSLHNYNQNATAGAESFGATTSEPFRPSVLYSSAIDQPADNQTEAFLDHLQESLQQNLQESTMNGDSEEGFFDVIRAGVRFAGKGVLAAVEHGLPILVNVMKQSGGAESFEDEPSSGPTAQILAAGPLAQRALVADAALTAVMRIPSEQLQEEGFFEFLGNAVRTIAPIAMKVAPVIVGAINPTIGKVVGDVLRQESASSSESTMLGSALPRRAVNQGLSAKRSLQNLRGGSAHGDDRRSRFEQLGTNRSLNGTYNRRGRQLNY